MALIAYKSIASTSQQHYILINTLTIIHLTLSLQSLLGLMNIY
jgi:hypothetical protein